MNITLTGPIVYIGEIKTGISKAGKQWSKREVVIEHESGEYPKKVVITCMNGACEALDSFFGGETISIEASIDCKEYNGKYYNNINGFKVQKA